MQEATDLAAALAAVRAVAPRIATATDAELLADAGAVEAVGRVVDAWRVAAAAELEHRSRPTLGEDRLSFREGVRDGVELVAQVARVSGIEAKRRVGLGAALAPTVALNGELLPHRLYGELAEAVGAGDVGLDSARVIVRAVQAVRERVMTPGLRFLVSTLTKEAVQEAPAAVKEDAAVLASALDPDGAEPRDRVRRRKRALRLGDIGADGMTRLTMVLPPEELAIVKELLQSRRRNADLARTAPGGDETETIEPEWREKEGPDLGSPRSRAQQDLDTVIDAIRGAMRAEQDGAGGSQVTHEVVVTVTAGELEARHGQGWTAGVLAGLPIPTVERIACSGGTRLLVTSDDGEPLHLGRSRRRFSAGQRKALLVRAGGRCEYGGCRTPSPYLDAHHVDWYQRDDGGTDVDNGIMLCSYHHHLIHATGTPVEIRRHDGGLFIVSKRWTGPPDPLQRVGRGVRDEPGLADFLRRHDPDTHPWVR